jgi:hypothetical protein
VTNKTERFLVMSEAEFEAALEASFEVANAHPARIDEVREAQETLKKAEAACRAREVRFIGAAEQGSSLMLWGEVKK